MSDSDDDFEFGETLDWVAESLRSVAASEVQIKTELGRNIRQKDNSETFTDLEIKMDSDVSFEKEEFKSGESEYFVSKT